MVEAHLPAQQVLGLCDGCSAISMAMDKLGVPHVVRAVESETVGLWGGGTVGGAALGAGRCAAVDARRVAGPAVGAAVGAHRHRLMWVSMSGCGHGKARWARAGGQEDQPGV